MADATSELTFALGRDVSGKPYAVDLGRMPHLLIAGATGSGKSVCVNAIITSILMRAKPDRGAASCWSTSSGSSSPPTATSRTCCTDVIMEAHEARAALAWAVGEMEERYKKLAEVDERNIAAYNAAPDLRPRGPHALHRAHHRRARRPDDPARDARSRNPSSSWPRRPARSASTSCSPRSAPASTSSPASSRPTCPAASPSRMASNVDSRTVLDQPGAEDLIGRGDMLYQPADLPRPVRLQGVFVSDAEVHAVADHWREQEPEPPLRPRRAGRLGRRGRRRERRVRLAGQDGRG